jgi:hypothetical protein
VVPLLFLGAGLLLVQPCAADSVFSATGSLGTARYDHTATLLPNGKVLVAGGTDNSFHAVTSAELYNPASGTWMATGSMNSSGSVATATLLANGKVLVTEYNGNGVPASAELYDPTSGTWTVTGSLATTRRLNTATLLLNGKVLVTGGYGSTGSLATAELYDPASGTWTATGSLATPRVRHITTLLPNGKVLVEGGSNDSNTSLASAELYDPASGTWTATGSLANARNNHTATLLPNGKVLVAGGYNGSSLVFASSELYDPASGTWTATGDLLTVRGLPTATLLPNGQVLVAGGFDGSGVSTTSAELYDPASGTWMATGSLVTSRGRHTATLLPNDKVLIAAGYHNEGDHGMALASAELYTEIGDQLFVSAPNIGAIYKILPDATQTTFAQVGGPRGLAFDSGGNLFVGDSSTGTIIRITPAGVHSTFASGLTTPHSMAFDTLGNLFVADIGTNAIYKFTPAGAQSTFASNLSRPAGLAFDSAGNLYESEGNGTSILKFTPAGVQSTFGTGVNQPAGLCFDSQGFLYEADQGTDRVLKFAPNGTSTIFATLDSSVDNAPVRPIVDSAGNIYLSVITQAGGGTIYKFTPAGVRNTFVSETTVVSFMAFGPAAVVAAPSAQLLNVATRLKVLNGDNVLIGGFIITGTEPKKVLILGIGPSLAQFFSGSLADPTLELYQGNTLLQMNDDWKTDQQAEVEATGAQPSNDSESAIVRTLDPGSYTAILRGKGDTTGIGVVQAYDLNQAANSKFGNIATRGFVDSGDNAMIGGFIIGPASGGSTTVVVRAIGPSLTNFGVNGALPDPTIELHDGNGATIAFNDNWADDASQGSIPQSLKPGDPHESALYRVLPPGGYTAIMRGAGNSTGIGLVEVYNVE